MGAKSMLKNLTGKKHVYLVDRCNTAIKYLLSKYKNKTFLLQDQGGWLTYRNAKKKIFLKTKQGIIQKMPKLKNSVLLINSMPSYSALQDFSKINLSKHCMLINDVSGSIGTENSKIGNIIIGSFGKWKPINLGYGGFIASNQKLGIKESFDKTYLNKLELKIKNLSKRLKYLKQTSEKIKSDLKHHNILHKHHKAINVIVKFKTEEQKSKIVKYCKTNNLPYTICPRYIRINENAVSIEVKRL